MGSELRDVLIVSALPALFAVCGLVSDCVLGLGLEMRLARVEVTIFPGHFPRLLGLELALGLTEVVDAADLRLDCAVFCWDSWSLGLGLEL